jgi:hypothetical protein
MSSSGLIYAFIVGGWAVYLVPMWLRREDELNKARQTQRYTAAIKVLSHKDSFERKHAGAAGQEEALELPLAAGHSGAASGAGRGTLERVRAKDRERDGRGGTGGTGGGGSGDRDQARETGTGGRGANIGAGGMPAGVPSALAASGRRVPHGVTASFVPKSEPAAGEEELWTPGPEGAATSSSAASGAGAGAGVGGPGPRSGLRARRRRVVSVLFALTSLGAIVSADLGLGYVWAMLLPAAVLTAYIASVRKDERARAAQRARRRAAAARAAREAERRRLAAEAEREQDQLLRSEREREQVEREQVELARRNAAARRRLAAARSRADRRAPGAAPHARPDQDDLPRAANG